MAATYYLAIDVGTSRTAAATSRLAPDGTLLTTSFPLGRNSDNVPTSMFVSNSELLFGDAAERRGITDPERLVREFKRRIGDDIPIVAGDRRFRPEEVFALMVGWVVDTVSAREGRLPSAIAVTVPAAWGEYRTQRVEDALARHGWASVTLVTEPEAAARHYVTTNPLEVGQALAVYDLGGGTFDAIVLRRERGGEIRMAGAPTGIENIGGADFDDAMLRHAIGVGGLTAESLGDERVALAAFRRECVDAKEALSFDSEAVIPLLVGGGGTVRVTRAEFEEMIEAQISRTADVLEETIHASKVKLGDVEAILLTGGSSRIPRVSQLLSERFDRPIAVDADPKAIIAMGAARSLSDRAGVVVGDAAPAEPAPGNELEEVAVTIPGIAVAASAEVGAAGADADEPDGDGKKRKRRYWLPAAALASVGAIVVAAAVMNPLAASTKDGTTPVAALTRFSSLLTGKGDLSTTPPEAAAAPPLINAGNESNAQPNSPSKKTSPAAPKTFLNTLQHPSPGNSSQAPSANYNPTSNPSKGGSSGGSTGSTTPSNPPATTTPSNPPATTPPATTPTPTPTPTETQTQTPTPTPTPTETQTQTPTPTPSETQTQSPAPAPDPAPSGSSTP